MSKPQAPLREVRAYSSEVRASPTAEGEIRFTGHAALFNAWSEDLGGFREQVAPGAFTKAIQMDDVRALLNHNADYVLGRNRAGTLTLSEDDQGLHFDVLAEQLEVLHLVRPLNLFEDGFRRLFVEVLNRSADVQAG